MRIKLLILIIIHCAALTSIYAQDVERAAQSRKWQTLLHYRPTIFRSHQSEIAPSDFFLSPDGHKSLIAELRATIEGFKKSPQLACRYPARRRFLIEEMGLKISAVRCEKYENWRAIFVPQSLSLVLASAFFGNAASSFGDTFLRIDGALTTPTGPRNALLDYGLNFAAQVPPADGAIKFAYKGLTGGYRGEFSILPYVQKIQEYRDREERDLWEYRLSLTSEQIERLLEHLWELETSYIPYYFLNKNCSYNLLSLLEVANPAWQLTDSFTYWTLPTDTIKVLMKTPNAVTDIKFRPSLHRLLIARLKNMSPAERKDFLRLRANSTLPPDSHSAIVLDSLIDEQKFLFGHDSDLYPETEKKRLKSLLQARALAPGKTHHIPPQETSHLRVDQTSGSRKISFAAGQTANRGFREIEFRPAYHDALDADQGALSFSEISVLGLRLRQFPEKNKNIHLDKLNLVHIVSMSPSDALQTRMSWMLDAGIATAPDEMAVQVPSGKTRYIQAGAGLSTYLLKEKENLLLFSFLKMNIEHSDNRSEKFRYGPSVQAGLLLRLFDNLKAGLSTEYFSYRQFDQFEDETHFNISEFQLSWIFHPDWNLRGEQRLFNDPNKSEHKITLSRYF